MLALILANLFMASFFFRPKSPRIAIWVYLIGTLSVLTVIVITAGDVYEHPTPISIAGIFGTLILFTAAIINAVKRMRAKSLE